MEKLFGLLLVASAIMLVVGLLSPRQSLCWLPTTPTRLESGLLYLGLCGAFFLLFGLAIEVKTWNDESDSTGQAP